MDALEILYVAMLFIQMQFVRLRRAKCLDAADLLTFNQDEQMCLLIVAVHVRCFIELLVACPTFEVDSMSRPVSIKMVWLTLNEMKRK